MKLKQQPKTFSVKELDEAWHNGYKSAEKIYSKQALTIENNQLKEEIRRLKNGL